MWQLAAGRRKLVLDEAGRLQWLSGDSGRNRVAERSGPVLRLVALQAGRRVALLPSGQPHVQAEVTQLTVTWNQFITPDGLALSIRAQVTVAVADGVFVWRLRVEPGAVQVTEALYPAVGGLQGDALVMPHHAGERILDPARTLPSQRYQAFHRGQTLCEEDGTFSRELPYCGLASMAWLELDGPDGGTYLGSHDPAFGLAGLRVETDGDSLTLAIRRYCKMPGHGAWEAPPAVLLPHDGDWHLGARYYRTWIEPHLPSPQRPACLSGRSALNPRYDFKNNGIKHRFADIPAMYDAGAACGLDHFFIAGWNRGGFDANYPEYYPDMELGSARELADGCRYITERGGVTTFYINARIFDTKSAYYPTLGTQWAIKSETGSQHFEVYEPNRFAVICPSADPWRRHLADTADWLLRTTGCEGIYLDQLGSATPFACYDPAHGHDAPDSFNRGYIALLDQLRDRAALMIENCGDIYSSRIWGSLTWNGELYDEFFNLYRYTFPEHNLICMVHPRHMDDPAERERYFYRDLDRAWLLGAYCWAAPQRRFKPGDDALLRYLHDALQLRRNAETYFAGARFVDTEGFRVHGDAAATRFEGEGFSLLAVANPNGAEGDILLAERPESVTCLALGQTGERAWDHCGDRLPLPQAGLSLLILREGKKPS